MREELGNFGASAIVNETREKATGNISVSVRTLDEHIDEFKNVAFMKMDVEGFELKVLKGAQAFILTNQPVIVLEQHAHDFRSGTTPAIELLQQMDYTICWHQSGLKSKRKLIRLASNLFELWSGRHHKIVTGEQVPEDFH